MENEKRRFPRARVLCKVSAVYAERVLVLNAHTENIGEGGVCVILEEKLHVPTEVGVELFFSERKEPLSCKGEVVWVRSMDPVECGPALYETGIKFFEIDAGDTTLISSRVNAARAGEESAK
jgi:hypothetical protein